MNANTHADATAAGRPNTGGGRRRSLWKTPALITALILPIPMLGAYFIDDWNWAPSAFVVLGILLFGMGFTYQLITRNRDSIAYRAAVCIAFVTSFTLTWGSFVQMADVTSAAAMYFVVPIVEIIGAVAARLQPKGMARALFATAITQALVLTAAFIILLTQKPQLTSWTPPELRGFAGNAICLILILASAFLFRKAERNESAPVAA